jgi:hypothetical protein
MEKVKYTKQNILDFVNENCSADFDEIVILDPLAGYRVHSDQGKYNTSERYNFGDTFNYDAALTKRRRARVEEMKKEFCILFNQEHDNTSYYIENNKLTVCINVEERKRIAAGYAERKFVVDLV